MKRTLLTDGWLFTAEGKPARPVTLPHDAMQEQGRSPDAPSGRSEAFFSGGRYCYERQLFAPEDWREKTLLLEFEGVYPTAKVFLNGEAVGGCAYGYSLFRVPLKELHYGGYNTVCVEVDAADEPTSRWYPGAGVYRPVWLLEGERTHILPGGVRVTTLGIDPAEVLVETACTDADAEITTEVFLSGRRVACACGASVRLRIPDAQFWSAETPTRYDCAVTVKKNGRICDRETVCFGIRRIEWSAGGLLVNGQSVKLRGGCIHHDNGILGARSFPVTEYRRIRRLKEFGFNAVRSAHNPLCRAALEACDELGMYVMDEAWDMWTAAKSPFDYASRFRDGWEYDLHAMVEKDYNHPSVLMYSIGNEVTEPAKPEGVELAAKLARTLRVLDGTRPVTAGINITLLFLATLENNPLTGGGGSAVPPKMDSTEYNKMVMEQGARMNMAAALEPADKISTPVLDLLDIAGYNYAVSRYAHEGELHPGRIVVGSETYSYELAKTWPLVQKYPYIIGDFMWTAWDYLGEVGIGSWSYDGAAAFDKRYPWLLADTGAFDILGCDNAEAGLASVVWRARKTPYIAVCPINHPGVTPVKAMWRGSNAIPSWSWRGCEGNNANVEIYADAAEIRLYLNDVFCGSAPVRDCRADICIPYAPGELRAEAYDADGKLQGASTLCSAGKCGIRLTLLSAADGIAVVAVEIADERGIVESNADTLLNASVENGELLAFGSARPCTSESFLSGSYESYYGRCQAIVRMGVGVTRLRVDSAKLESAVLTLPDDRQEKIRYFGSELDSLAALV